MQKPIQTVGIALHTRQHIVRNGTVAEMRPKIEGDMRELRQQSTGQVL
jgi:hypothetical protein